MKYSLDKYVMTIIPDSSSLKEIFGTSISIGGNGSYHNSITVSPNGTLWSVKGFATGGYVHDKNLDKTGSVSVSISQLSPQVAKFIALCNYYYSHDDVGCTILVKNGNTTICSCKDCYISNIVPQEFGESAAMQNWTFVSGKIDFI